MNEISCFEVLILIQDDSSQTVGKKHYCSLSYLKLQFQVYYKGDSILSFCSHYSASLLFRSFWVYTVLLSGETLAREKQPHILVASRQYFASISLHFPISNERRTISNGWKRFLRLRKRSNIHRRIATTTQYVLAGSHVNEKNEDCFGKMPPPLGAASLLIGCL